MTVTDTIPGLDDGYRKDAQKYLERFYQTISRPNDVKKAFVEGCDHRAGI